MYVVDEKWLDEPETFSLTDDWIAMRCQEALCGLSTLRAKAVAREMEKEREKAKKKEKEERK